MAGRTLSRDEAIRKYERAIDFRMRGRTREAVAILDDLSVRAEEDVEVLVPVLNERALAEKQLGDHDAARRTLHELLQLFEEGSARDPLLHASIIDNLGFVERESGNLSAARAHHERAVQMLRALDARAELAHSLIGLAVVLKDLGLLYDAQKAVDEALPLVSSGDRGLIGYVRTVRGLIFQLLREWERARREFVTAVVSYRAAGDDENRAVALHNLATVEYERRRIGLATRLLQTSRKINERLRIHAGVANDLRRLALYAGDVGALVQARALLLRARRAALRAGDRATATWCQLDVGRVALESNDPREAVRRCTSALEDAKSLDEPFLLHEVLLARGAALRRCGRREDATADLKAAVSALERLRAGAVTEDLALRFFTEIWDAYVHLVELSVERGDLESAWSWAERTRGREIHRRLRRSLSLQPRAGVPEAVMRERELLRELESLETAATAERASDVTAELQPLWSIIETDDPEYVALRRGDHLTFAELRRDLSTWSAPRAS